MIAVVVLAIAGTAGFIFYAAMVGDRDVWKNRALKAEQRVADLLVEIRDRPPQEPYRGVSSADALSKTGACTRLAREHARLGTHRQRVSTSQASGVQLPAMRSSVVARGDLLLLRRL
jgi:hypothetical protein